MKTSSKNIVFDVDGMTHLRYLIPIADVITRVYPSAQLYFVHDENGTKYNAIMKHKRCYDEIMASRPHIKSLGVSKAETLSITFTALFSIEASRLNVQRNKHYAVAHGFDSAVHGTELMKSKFDGYICNEHLINTCKRFGPVHVPPLPVAFWTYSESIDFGTELVGLETRPIVHVFYPDRGHIDLANNTIDELIKRDYSVIVKQRRKHQTVSGTHTKCRIVYDESWYPSESIAIPLVAAATIGFGSSAYTDIVPAGLYYINANILYDNPHYPTFIHFAAENYVHIKHPTVMNIADAVDAAIISSISPQTEEINTFVRGLFDG